MLNFTQTHQVTKTDLFKNFIADANEHDIVKAKQSVNAAPVNAKAWNDLGVTYYKHYRENLSYKINYLLCFERAFRLEPNNVEYLYQYWTLRGNAETDLKKAMACYAQVVSCNALSNKKQGHLWNAIAAKYAEFDLGFSAFYCLFYSQHLDYFNVNTWWWLKHIYQNHLVDEERAIICSANIERLNQFLLPLPLVDDRMPINKDSGDPLCPDLNILNTFPKTESILPIPSLTAYLENRRVLELPSTFIDVQVLKNKIIALQSKLEKLTQTVQMKEKRLDELERANSNQTAARRVLSGETEVKSTIRTVKRYGMR
ncbi:MAG: hypothetical protein BGO43_04975 [Gammaproteobacteria bacterium 39-13]|nr:hypothetical protein [Gammaproteobacteria bacterium]OJV96204.1 MAG: hypothetical protein BGO43_04975 [Gammaproteobacteria bacterium 39-13]